MRRYKTHDPEPYSAQRRGGYGNNSGRMMLSVLSAALFLGLLGGFMLAGGGRSVMRQFDQEQRAMYLEEQAALLPWKIAGGIAVRGAGILMLAGATGGVMYAAWIALAFLDRRARLIHARDGIFPIVEARGDITIYDPNRSTAGAVRIDKDGYAIPQMQPAQLLTTAGALEVQKAAAWASGGGAITTNVQGGALPAGNLPMPPGVELPSKIPLKGLLAGDAPSLARLALGVAVNPQTGQLETITGNMAELVHVAVGGSSGWGKSVFLRCIAYQLILAQERPDLVMVDLEGVTLAPFANCGRLLYPLADNEQAAAAVLEALSDDELNRRKALFARFPGVDHLAAYNAVAPEPLRPIVAIVDEATALLGNRNVESALRVVALRARKYGLWLLLAGQDWKASSLDSAIRNQLATRVQFKALSGAQSRVLLGQSGAEALDTPGRALAVLPGRDLLTIQTPFINNEALAGLGNGGPQRTLAEIATDAAPAPVMDDTTLDNTARALLLHRQGVSGREIQKRLFGYVGGAAFDFVTQAISHNNNALETA